MIRRLMNKYSFPLFVLTLIIPCLVTDRQVQARPHRQYTPPENIQVEMFALHPITRAPVDPCQMGDTDYGCGTDSQPYPNPTNLLTVGLEDEYLPYVVAEEMNNGHPEAQKAQAVVSRSYALHLIDVERTIFNNTSRHQVFARRSPRLRAEHTQAAQATRGIILACGDTCWADRYGFPIFAEYSPAHPGSFTLPAGNLAQHPYLAAVYDPIHSGQEGHGRGMSQDGADRWARGLRDDNDAYPLWDFLRILAHYFTAVEFQNVPNVRNDYRFNVIRFTNFPDNTIFYTTERLKDDITVVLQNTGTLDWRIGEVAQDTCGADSYNLALSYHLYDDSNERLACGDPDAPGGNPCFEGVRTPLCLSSDHSDFDLDPGHPPFAVDNVTVVLPPDLPPNRCYTLRWDIELLNNHQETTWISHLQENPAQAQWSTQDVRICYFQKPVAQNPDPPDDSYASSGHKANQWSNNPAIAIAWEPPDTPVTGYEYRYQGPGSNLDGDWHFTTQTNVAFTAAADGSHSLQLRSVRGDSKSRTG